MPVSGSHGAMERVDLFVEGADPARQAIDILLAGQIQLRRKRADPDTDRFFDLLLAGNLVQHLTAAGNHLIHNQLCILADPFEQLGAALVKEVRSGQELERKLNQKVKVVWHNQSKKLVYRYQHSLCDQPDVGQGMGNKQCQFQGCFCNIQLSHRM